MLVGGLAIPQGLLDLIAAGFWPDTHQGIVQPELLPPDVVSALFPGEHGLFLYAPPFQTVGQLVADGERFWTDEIAAPGEIDFNLTIAIADFGHGSDAPIVLDYRRDREEPAVMRLQYSSGQAPPGPAAGPRTGWVVIADTFDQFANSLGLDEAWAGHGRIFPHDEPTCHVWLEGDTGHSPHRCANPVVALGFITSDRTSNVAFACAQHEDRLLPDPPDLHPGYRRNLEVWRAKLLAQPNI